MSQPTKTTPFAMPASFNIQGHTVVLTVTDQAHDRSHRQDSKNTPHIPAFTGEQIQALVAKHGGINLTAIAAETVERLKAAADAGAEHVILTPTLDLYDGAVNPMSAIIPFSNAINAYVSDPANKKLFLSVELTHGVEKNKTDAATRNSLFQAFAQLLQDTAQSPQQTLAQDNSLAKLQQPLTPDTTVQAPSTAALLDPGIINPLSPTGGRSMG